MQTTRKTQLGAEIGAPHFGSIGGSTVQAIIFNRSRHNDGEDGFGSALSGADRPPASGFGHPHAQPSQGPPAQPICVQWRPKEPLMFFGRAPEDVNTWVSIVSNYFGFMSGTPQQEVAYAATLLSDAPHD